MFRRWRRLRSAWLTFCNGEVVAAAAAAAVVAVVAVAAAAAAAAAINRPRTFAALSFIRCANEQQQQQLTHIHMRAYVHTHTHTHPHAHTHTHRRASLQRVVKSERGLCVRTLTAGSSCANGRSAPVLPPTMLLLLPPTHAAPLSISPSLSYSFRYSALLLADSGSIWCLVVSCFVFVALATSTTEGGRGGG